jgi:hypothetical protein
MNCCKGISLPTPHNEHKVKKSLHPVYECKQQPTASPQNNKKNLPVSKYFPFTAGVVDTGDQPLLSNISENFPTNLKWDSQGPR